MSGKVLVSADKPTRSSDLIVVSPLIDGGVRDYGAMIADAFVGSHAAFTGGQVIFEPGKKRFEPNAFYIQYSGYGYQARGVPLALARWIRARKKEGAKVGVFFHEL